MNVVFLSYAFPPAKYPRSIQVSRLAVHSKLPIKVIHCVDDSPRDPTIMPPDALDSVPMVGIPATAKSLIDRLSMPDAHRGWALAAARELLAHQYVQRSDVLVTFGMPMSDHLAGLQLIRALGLPWIAHFSDPWADNPYRPKWAGWSDRRLEKSVVAAADRLIFTSPQIRQLVMAKYPADWLAKAHVLPHAFDGSRQTQQTRDGPFLLRHLGNFYNQRSPAPLIGALRILSHRHSDLKRELQVDLVGTMGAATGAGFDLSGLPEGLLKVLPAVDYQVSLDMMAASDLLVVIDAAAKTNVFLPSKLVDYVGAGRPIFAISPPGASADLVGALGGQSAAPNDPAAIADGLAGFIAAGRWPHDRAWGEPSVRRKYDAETVAAAFDAIVHEVMTS